ncbi:methylmalonyl-CoA mutase subunit beta [Boseaceae bacterium BT-24-1]|nr:methylmalonyl-CoA mutase subunit beta [Boseaceae bacterium BT-24-1]
MSEPAYAEAFPIPALEQWRRAVEKVLKGASFEDTLVGQSADGFPIQPLYEKAVGDIVIGRRDRMPWHVTARVDHPDGHAAAALASTELEGGATSLALVMAGNRFARGQGLVARSPAELDAVLAGVDLDLIHLWIEPCAGFEDADLVAAMVLHRGLPPDQLDVDFGIDPLGEAAATGSAPASMEQLGDRLFRAFERLRGHGFTGPICRADGRSYHEAGATEGQELACVLATLVAYLRALEGRGLELHQARAAISAAMAADTDQLLTIAKFRALRRLWDRAQDACGLVPEPIALHAETSWRMLTQRDAHVNILRGTIATFSAGVAGADSIVTLPYDQALGLPDTLARRIARNTQLILQHESNLWRVVDPAAGSGGIEAMTDELCRIGWQLFQDIESRGGMLPSLADGAIGRMLRNSRCRLEEAIATCRLPIIGTSIFPNLAEPRNQRQGGFNIAPAPEPATQSITVPTLPSFRLSEGFEAIRDRSERAAAESQGPPRVFVAALGDPRQVTPHVAHARGLFAAGGIEAIVEDGLDGGAGNTVERAATRWQTSGASVFCLCISDDLAKSLPDDASHPTDTLAEAIGMRVRQAGAALLVFAGTSESEGMLRAAGFSYFLRDSCDAQALLDASLSAHSEWSNGL